MNIAEYSIHHRTVTWMVLILIAVGGAVSFLDLGRLEDPPFIYKDAMIITAYPGATAEEVELELTHPLENAIRQLANVDTISSTSKPGLSQILVEMEQEINPEEVDQLWDRLRRKVSDAQPGLPRGSSPPQVIDDYGDIYGITLMVTGDNFEFSELKQYVDGLKRELELVSGVGKVTLFGVQQEQIFVEISMEKLAALDLDFHQVVGFLNQQNSVLDAGRVTINGEMMHLRLGGLDMDIDPVIHGRDSGKLVHLSDIATIRRGYQEVPSHLMRMNGKPAISMGISFASKVNVVEVGERIDILLEGLEPFRPAGLSVDSLYNQPHEVKASVNGFLRNLGASVLIVIAALLVAMGWRSGLIVGVTLLLTVLGTFILMKIGGFQLHRMSLGALIIALGMLVDNAIVVVEGAMVGVARGVGKRQACYAIVNQTRWPLLAATLIAILAFTPFGLSGADAGQILKALFWVLTYSLFLSWLLAISITPFLVDLLMKDVAAEGQASKVPYQGPVYGLYRGILDKALRFRKSVIVLMLLMLVLAVFGMGLVKKGFFTTSNTPMFYVDLWLPYGTDIRETLATVEAVEDWVRGYEKVEFVSSTVGRSAPRFFMTYLPEQSYENFGQIQVRATDLQAMEELMQRVDNQVYERFPQILHQMRHMVFGPPTRSEIEARFRGPDPKILRDLGEQAAAILRADPGARSVFVNWRERVKELVPVVNESEARRLGISNEEIASSLKIAFGGLPVGVYRDGTRTLPIVVRLPEADRVNYDRIDNLRMWSPTLQTYVPIQQLVSRVDVRWADALILRKDRQRTLTVRSSFDKFSGQTAEHLYSRIKPKLEAIPLPAGYSLNWGGEFENSGKALAASFRSLPIAILMMFSLTVLLFNAVRRSLVIWLTVPLALIGVSIGLLAMDLALTFPAVLGILALIGMVLKNGIVLVDQIMVELAEGKHAHDAVHDAAISRMRPVSMAAATTVLGMLPLLWDPFFASLAATLIFGLSFATVLTLVIVPVLYLTFHRIAYRKR